MRICTVAGCERKHKAQGYCNVHYKRLCRGLPLDAPIHSAKATPPRRARSQPVLSEPKPASPLVTKADFLVWREQRKRARGRDRIREMG